MADVYRHRIVDPDRRFVPHGAVEFRRRKDLAGVLHEIIQDVIFLRRERDRLSVERDALRVMVKADAADRQLRRRFHRRAQLQESSQLRFDSRQHLHGVKGLCDIIVRAHAEAQNFVRILGFCREQNHRNIGELPQPRHGRDAVHAGHHDIHQRQLHRLRLRNPQRFLAAVSRVDAVAVGFQINFQSRDDILLIVADQNMLHNRFPSVFFSVLSSYPKSYEQTSGKRLKIL